MLNLYRRHTKKCPQRAKREAKEKPTGRTSTKCACPIWAYGEIDGKIIRKSVGVSDWARAGKRIAKWEERPEQLTAPKTVQAAIESYLGDCRARKLKESTLVSYSKTLEHFRTFCL